MNNTGPNDPPLRAGPGRRFQKGKSGNPGGQTRAAAAMQRLVPTLISELTHGGADLVMMLLRIAAGAEPGMEDARSRAWAIRELLDRNLGRPALAVKVDSGPVNDTPPLDDRDLTDEELEVLAKLDAPAKVLKLVPIPAAATEVSRDGDGGTGGG